MTFTPNIPNTGQSLGQTKNPIRGNFLNYFNTISVDHVEPNLSGAGEHAQVTFNDPIALVDTFTPAASKSFLCSSPGSASGTQIAYQPSVVDYYIPVSVRALGRIKSLNIAPYFSIIGGPYDNTAAHAFNFGSLSALNQNTFTVNFSSALADDKYFIMISQSRSNFLYVITAKTTAGFQVTFFSNVTVIDDNFMYIMVF